MSSNARCGRVSQWKSALVCSVGKLQQKGFVVAKFVSETWQPKMSVQKWGVQTRELSLLLGHSEL